MSDVRNAGHRREHGAARSVNEAAPVPGAQPATRPTAVSALCGQGIAAHGLWRAIAMDAKTEYDASALSAQSERS